MAKDAYRQKCNADLIFMFVLIGDFCLVFFAVDLIFTGTWKSSLWGIGLVAFSILATYIAYQYEKHVSAKADVQEQKQKMAEEKAKAEWNELCAQMLRQKTQAKNKTHALAPLIALQKSKEEDEKREQKRIQHEAWLELLRQARARGEDVCMNCETLHPKRCPHNNCGACISGCSPSSGGEYCLQCASINPCGDPNCNGWCYICDDDDDYDAGDPLQCQKQGMR